MVGASLLICAACSNRSEIVSAPRIYAGVPQGLLARCVVKDVTIETTGDLLISRNLYKAGFDKCAAQVDAIREHDRKARSIVSGTAE